LRRESSQGLELSPSQKEDLRLAGWKLSGADRRSFQAEIALKYCGGSARKTERLLGWSRNSIELGLAEKRTGIICVGAQAHCSGIKRWEERYPETAAVLCELADAASQQDPTFGTTLAYTRLTAAEAVRQLLARGYAPETLPSVGSMFNVLNRLDYRLRPVVKARPKKNCPKRMPSSRTSKPKTPTPTRVVSNA
jgi:hypothetical protein